VAKPLPLPEVALRRVVDHYSRYHDIAEEWLPQLGLNAHERGHFTRDEFLRVCKWKAPRAQWRYRANDERAVANATHAAISARSDDARLRKLLTGLKGIRVPIASALLAAFDPEKFGVIDVRAWQALFGSSLFCVGKVVDGEVFGG
jgi:hypothetical protein